MRPADNLISGSRVRTEQSISVHCRISRNGWRPTGVSFGRVSCPTNNLTKSRGLGYIFFCYPVHCTPLFRQPTSPNIITHHLIMSYPALDLSVTPAYRPAPYLVSGPGAFLTADELTRYFEGWSYFLFRMRGYSRIPRILREPRMHKYCAALGV